jgi:hypothetical protein
MESLLDGAGAFPELANTFETPEAPSIPAAPAMVAEALRKFRREELIVVMLIFFVDMSLLLSFSQKGTNLFSLQK